MGDPLFNEMTREFLANDQPGESGFVCGSFAAFKRLNQLFYEKPFLIHLRGYLKFFLRFVSSLCKYLVLNICN